MINMKLRNESCSEPANSDSVILKHPSGNSSHSIELAYFNDHRYAFYYWSQWRHKQKQDQIPDLITFDWHQDLGFPSEESKLELKQLDFDNNGEISFYAWARLNPNNDDHILAAAYANLIGNVWVVCKQNQFNDWGDEEIIDMYGNKHVIKKFKEWEHMSVEVMSCDIPSIYLDIDLDFFTIENNTSNDRYFFTYMKDDEIKNIFNPATDFTKWIFERMEGFTIALEPKCTGGISKSLKYISLLTDLFFDQNFHNWECNWKHLSD